MDKANEQEELIGILRLISPGTMLRAALDDISKAKLGALIVVNNSPEVLNLVNGGFEVNCKFSSQKLVELCKMDGAVILDSEIRRILYANTMLVPDYNILTNETGTRHKAAERTAKQTNQLVIAVSERKGSITLYKGGIRYVLQQTQDLLSKAGETLRMAEKNKEMFNELVLNLNVLEFTNLANLNDIIMILQRAEIISRIEEIIRRYIIELGIEGSLVKLQLKEIRKGLDNEEISILKDYCQGDAFLAKVALSELSLDEIIEPINLVRILNYQKMEDKTMTRGYRLLDKTSLDKNEIECLIREFKNLPIILESEDKISAVIDGKKADKVIKELSQLKEQALLGKKI